MRQIEKEMRAIATIGGPDGINGVVYLSQNMPPAGAVTLNGIINGLKPGKHGIHVNQLGDLRDNCQATGQHYNPYNFSHGPPSVRHRHLGDLGNIEADADGVANFTITDKMMTLSGSRSIVGRPIVIDGGEDTFSRIKSGKENNDAMDDSKDKSKDSPVACGIIGRMD